MKPLFFDLRMGLHGHLRISPARPRQFWGRGRAGGLRRWLGAGMRRWGCLQGHAAGVDAQVGPAGGRVGGWGGETRRWARR